MILRFAVFSFVGLISTIVDLISLLLLVQLGISNLSAVSIAFSLGLIVNMVLHARVTFSSKINIRLGIRFFAVVGLNYTITIALVSMFQLAGQSYLLGKIVSLPVTAVSGFLLSKHWVFSHEN